MASYLIPSDSWDFSSPIFAFDCDLSESRDDSWTWTKYAIEAGANVSDYGMTEPRVYSLSGLVTAWLAASDDEVFTRCGDAHAKLVEYANTRQPVTLVCGTWCDDVVITKVGAKKETSGGEALAIDITLQSYQVAAYETVEIPPELLAPAVKASATPDPAADGTGGGSAGATEDPAPWDPNTETREHAAARGVPVSQLITGVSAS